MYYDVLIKMNYDVFNVFIFIIVIPFVISSIQNTEILLILLDLLKNC